MTQRMTLVLNGTISREDLAGRLAAAGVDATIEGETYEADGVGITDARIRDAWNHDTGVNGCDGSCNGADAHRDWRSLSEAQRRTYAEAACRFMSAQQYEYMLPGESLTERELTLFAGIALSSDEPENEE